MFGQFSDTTIRRTIFGQRFAELLEIGRTRTYFFLKLALAPLAPSSTYFGLREKRPPPSATPIG